MTDVIEERLRTAADQAMTGVELTTPAGDRAAQRRHRRWLAAAAGTPPRSCWVWWCGRPRRAIPARPSRCNPHRTRAQVRARSAVEATLEASQWRAEVYGGVGRSRSGPTSPARESVNGVETVDSTADVPMRAIQIGDDLYVTNDGEWTRTTAAERSLADVHRSLLQAVLADGPCFADEGELIVAWQDPETGCGSSTTALPDDLPAGSDIWVLRVDEGGRVANLAVGEVPGDVGSDREKVEAWPPSPSDGIDRPVRRAGGQPAYIYSYTYDDVPPITAPDRYTTDATPPPITSDTGDTLPASCAIRVITTREANLDDVQQLTRRHDELAFEQQRPASEIAAELRTFPFVLSVTAPSDDCTAQAVALTVDPAG